MTACMIEALMSSPNSLTAPLAYMQALVGGLTSSTDVTNSIRDYCNLDQDTSYCPVPILNFNMTATQSLRVSWTCICGVGNDPTIDPTTGVCTPCLAGASPAWAQGAC